MNSLEPISPMEPVAFEKCFDSIDHLFQIKWDGVRCLAYIGQDVRLYNRKLRERTSQYPELVSALSRLPSGTVLDGEIVALNESGLPDFRSVLRRDLLQSPSAISSAQRAVSVQYVVFDMLMLNGEDCTRLALTSRIGMLNGAVKSEPPIAIANSIPQSGVALFDAVAEAGMEGVVAKRMDSPYLAGQKSRHWLKIKCWRDMEAHVLGYVHEGGEPRSLVLGVEDEGGWRYIGNASSGLNEAMRKAITSMDAAASAYGFESSIPGARWLGRGLCAKIRFLEWSANGKLRNPSILAIFMEGTLP